VLLGAGTAGDALTDGSPTDGLAAGTLAGTLAIAGLDAETLGGTGTLTAGDGSTDDTSGLTAG
jgi:hypothetical protein